MVRRICIRECVFNKEGINRHLHVNVKDGQTLMTEAFKEGIIDNYQYNNGGGV